ncbi:glycosyltransferase 87 family protein [Marisediminicola senii]|uniref:glycosyltransferase 87 family protein n=1 Tax=Marisediminicola senii TaxID=2711233 RepID=UPI0013EA00BA|nr:glycosyltransferase 87 family protein [Marisediminicola senii]
MTAGHRRTPANGEPVLPGWAGELARSPIALWAAFVAVHVVIGLLALYGRGYPLGDVTILYKFWIDQAFTADFWVGIDGPSVYPIVAIVPIFAAHLAYPIASAIPAIAPATAGVELYAISWLAMVTLLDLAAFAVLMRKRGTGSTTGPNAGATAAAWWWIAFLLALGPIAVGRIDAVTVPLAVAAVLVISTRPRVAALLLTVAAWIKVWPGAIVVAMVVTMRQRWQVLLTAVAASAGILGLTLSYGAGWNAVSFVAQQTGRGLQVEAPVTTAWMWLAWADVPGTSVYYDQEMLTWQVTGAGVSLTGSLVTPALLLVVALVCAAAVLAMRRGVDASAILPPFVLALVVGMIAMQKVGSPQFMSWLAVPVILGLVSHGAGRCRSFRVPAALSLVIAALTHVMYPYLYGRLLGLATPMLVVLTVRNALLFVLLGWAVLAMLSATAARRTPQHHHQHVEERTPSCS